MYNYDNVLGQLREIGLIVDRIETGRIIRCRVEGAHEKKGWYVLHEVKANEKYLLVGSFGIWQGNDSGAIKIKLDSEHELSKEQQSAIHTRLGEDAKRLKRQRDAEAAKAARRAESVWRKLSEEGESDYLHRKAVGAYGVRFTPSGAIAVPMLDGSGQMKGLQFILSKAKHKERIAKIGRDKESWPKGLEKKGAFHLIGIPGLVILLCEGYATGASLHAATGLCVAIAFDANNLGVVAKALKSRYRSAKILVCADDDDFGYCFSCKSPLRISANSETCPSCGEPHKRKNAGIEAAIFTALEVGGRYVFPRFSDDAARQARFFQEKTKLSDFNDLHLADGLHSVRLQIEAAIEQAGWATAKAVGESRQGGGENRLKPIMTVDELLERFALVIHMGGMVFDLQEHTLSTISDMRDACISRELARRWHENPGRIIVRKENVGFDPAGKDPNITCNIWSGWPTKPQAGCCERLLELLRYMCSGETRGEELYEWVLKWLAYPMQHPGAKMRTAVVVHGPQGTGKNLFFEIIMAIYGRYGRIIDQFAIEDKFNDWISGKLFLIADETLARQELFHIKNRLKGLITGEWVRINTKNINAYEERNHVNMVFLSNERMPTVLEEDDRRHAVIWTPAKLSETFYAEVAEEIANGGREALHDFLLNLELKEFNEHTKPPVTQAKADLIDLSKDSMARFLDAWRGDDIDGIKLQPALSEDVYELYRSWCVRQGVKAAQQAG